MQSQTGGKRTQLSPFLSFPVAKAMNPLRYSLGKKKEPWVQNYSWKHPLLRAFRAESQWCTCTFPQSCMHTHTLAHMLCAYTETSFVLSCFWRVPNPEVKAMKRETLEGSSIPVPIGWDVVRKRRWKMSLCFLGPLQQCWCEERSKLSLCQWGGTVSTLSFCSFLLFHCSSLCAFLWCEVASNTRRHLASSLHFGQDRKSPWEEVQSLIWKSSS